MPVQRPGPPLWRSVISPGSFTECGRLGVPILTARLPVDRIRDRWKLYEAGLEEGGHDVATRARLLDQSAVWRNVYVADNDIQAENELAELLMGTREHMMHVRKTLNPSDFSPDPLTLNAWTDPTVGHAEGVAMAMETGSIFGAPEKVRKQVAELRDAGVRHLLCQTAFGAMDHTRIVASLRRFGEQVMPAFQ